MVDHSHLKHPPLDFACLELAGSWEKKWLEFFEGEQGELVWAVTLGFADDRFNIYVKTTPRGRYDHLMSTGGSDPLLPLAEDAALSLINFGLAAGAAGPAKTAGTRQSLTAYVPELMENMASQYQKWNNIGGAVDGNPVVFRLCTFGGWWVAFSDSLEDRYVICHGNDRPVRELSLLTVRDITRYAADLDEPFDLDVFSSPEQAARRPISKAQLPMHQDYERFLAGF